MVNDPLDYQIRPLSAADERILWDMLYEGLHASESEPSPSRDILRRPTFAPYVEEWGRETDLGFVAFDRRSEQPIGAVWCRGVGGLGEVESHVEELALAVRSAYRRRGVGAALLTQWVRANPQQSAVKLRGSPSSPAVRLYERFGFRVAAEHGDAVTMSREG